MQRQNIHAIDDHRVPLYERSNTFDNTAHASKQVRATQAVADRLKAECTKMVHHIFAVEQRHVIRMVAFFAFNVQRQPVLFVSELQLTAQSVSEEDVRIALSHTMKRKLCMATPAIIASDVKLPAARAGCRCRWSRRCWGRGHGGSGGEVGQAKEAAMGSFSSYCSIERHPPHWHPQCDQTASQQEGGVMTLSEPCDTGRYVLGGRGLPTSKCV